MNYILKFSKTRLIAGICYCLQLHRFAYFLNRGRKRIITFHNVLADEVFVYGLANGVSNSFSQFKTIVDEVAKRYDFSLDLYDFHTITITFDDGYNNQVSVAAPYLIKKGIPAYLFVSGQLLAQASDCESNKTDPLIIDLLLHWVEFVPVGEYNIQYGDVKLSIEISDLNRQRVWAGIIWPAYLKDSVSKGYYLLKALDYAYSMNEIISILPEEYKKLRLRGVTQTELRNLNKNGWQIGYHAYSHYPLSKLTHEEKIKELSKLQCCSSSVLSFPFGGTEEVDADCLQIAQDLGYSCAVSNVIENSRLSGNWFLPRMALSPDPILLHFELSGLKYLLKYHRLLPKFTSHHDSKTNN